MVRQASCLLMHESDGHLKAFYDFIFCMLYNLSDSFFFLLCYFLVVSNVVF